MGDRVEIEGCRFTFSLEGRGAPVALVQGVGVCGSGWLPQVRELSSEFQCLTFDNRGMGGSQPVGRPLTVDRMARDTLALMSHVGWRSAHVVGHSLGGPIAIEMALLESARVRSLSLLCTVGRGRDATRLSGRMLKLGLLSRVGPRRSRRRAFLRIVLPDAAVRTGDPDVLARELEPLFGHDLADQPPVAMKQLAALRAFDATARLGALADKPTLVVAATHDPIAPPQFGRALAAGIPGARYVEIEDASHGVTIQHAARVNELLRAHITAANAG
jgi:pimeloyl-ACP methyl ester carboxylesterase